MKNLLNKAAELAKTAIDTATDAAASTVDYVEKAVVENQSFIDGVKSAAVAGAQTITKAATDVAETTSAAINGAVEGVKNKDKPKDGD